MPAVAVAAASTGAVVPLLVGSGDAYRNAVGVVPIVSLGSFVIALGLIGNTALVVTRETRPLIYAVGIGLVVNVAANLVLIPWLGIMGAAIATPISNAAFLLAAQHWARLHATWQFPWSTAARTGVAAAAGLGAAKGLESLFGRNLARLLVAVGSTLVVYLLALALVGERRSPSS